VRRLLVAIVCIASFLVTVPALDAQAGGLPGQVRVDKLVVGPGPDEGYEFTVTCESVTLPAEPIANGDIILLPVPWDESCEVVETVTQGASVTYVCESGGEANPCTGANTFEIDSEDPVTAIITITNDFTVPTSEPSSTTSTSEPAPVAGASTAPRFTG
jgi:hypothetical protein